MAQLFDTGIFSVIGVDSQILVGAKLYWYEAGTSTPVDTYSDPDLNIPNTNPVLADAGGRFPQIWLAPGDYKYILTAADSTPADPIATVDDLNVSSEPPSFSPSLDDFLSGAAPLPVSSGGTGAASAVNALTNLGAFPAAGGNVTGNITREGNGVHIYWAVAAMNSGEAYLTASADPDPTNAAGEIWFKY